MKFCILALPRSRTQWLAAFLTYGYIRCEHEYLSRCESVMDLEKLGCNGTSETLGVAVWPQIFLRHPKAQYVIVRRDVEQVRQSMIRQGFPTFDPGPLSVRLDMAARRIKPLIVAYDDINTRLREIWEHCRPDPFPQEREAMVDQYIATPVRDQLATVDNQRLRKVLCSR